MAIHAEFIVHAVFIEDATGLVGSMALNAGRHLMGFLFPEFAADDLNMGFLDIGMTVHAGFDHVKPADR